MKMNFITFLLEEFDDLLLEYRDWLNQRVSGIYGAWIDPDERHVHYVKPEGHAEFIEELMFKQNQDPGKYSLNQKYQIGFQLGLVRVVFPRNGRELWIEGKKDDIENAGTMIMSTLNTEPKPEQVVIDFVGAGHGTFSIPSEKYKLAKFIGME